MLSRAFVLLGCTSFVFAAAACGTENQSLFVDGSGAGTNESAAKPGAMRPGGDYRHFLRVIFDELPEYLRDIAPAADRRQGAGVDLQKIFGESFRFSSDPEPGLELVDIVQPGYAVEYEYADPRRLEV